MPDPGISGFTFVRNAVRLDFPVIGSIRSILPVCDEVVVAVGKSDDGTLELIRSISDSKIRIVETEWDMTRGRSVLADQTDIAMRACRHPWGIYIQADEVLGDGAAELLRRAILDCDRDPQVEGIVVDYTHFYGGFDTVATHRRMYRREVRAVRIDPAAQVHSFRDAQGFRVGAEDRKIRARLSGATMLHYGWARSAEGVQAKDAAHAEIYAWGEAERKDRMARDPFTWVPFLRPFPGPHPAVLREWIEERGDQAKAVFGPRHFNRVHVRYWFSAAIEAVTGWRPFEFRNYTLI